MKVPFFVIFVPVVFWGMLSCEKKEPASVDGDSYRISSRISNLNVRTIAEDSLGHIWIGTNRGLNRFTGKEYYQFYNSNEGNSINNNTINQIMYDSRGRCWITTISGVCLLDRNENFTNIPLQTRFVATNRIVETSEGDIIIQTSYRQLQKYDEESRSFRNIPVASDVLASLWSGGLFTATNNTLWILSGRRICQLDHTTGNIMNEVFFDTDVSAVIKSSNNQLLLYGKRKLLCFDMIKRQFVGLPAWVSDSRFTEEGLARIYYGNRTGIIYTDSNLYIYDDISKSTYTADSDASPYYFPEFSPSVIFVDSNRNVWMGTSDKGVHLIPYKGKIFNQKGSMINALKGKNIKSTASDGDNGLWAVTSGEIIYVDSKRNVYSVGAKESGISGSLTFIIHRKKDGTMWLAAGGKIYEFIFDGHELQILDEVNIGQSVVSMIEASDGKLYLATNYGQVYSVYGEDNSLRNIYKTQILEMGATRGYTSAYDICELSDGRLAATFFRTDIMIIEPETGTTEEMDYRSQTGELFHITCVFQDDTGRFWFGSRDRGVFYVDKDAKIMSLKETAGSSISDIRQDNMSRIWISTAQGLFTYNPEDGGVSYFGSVDGELGNQYNVNASCRLEDGTVVFGETNGIVTCHDVLFDTDRTFPIRFEQLKVNNEVVFPSDEGPLKESLQTAKEIRLRHWQNNISISFSLLNYQPYHTTNFMFILEGNDDTWTDIGTSNTIYISRLRPGKYMLKVTGSNQDKDSVIDNSIRIRVYPPWWSCVAAKIFYLLLFAGVVTYIFMQRQRKMRYKLNLLQARREKEHEKYLNKMNINFFGNMAHEFRSPLTMLTGPLEELSQSPVLNDEARTLVNTMGISINRMNKLVNQLLDFNKIDNGALGLRIERNVDVNAKLREYAEMAKARADRYRIEVTEEGLDTQYYISLDTDKLDSIVFNLFSNAFKFTKQGSVSLRLYKANVDEVGERTKLREDEVHCREYLCIDIENSSDPIDLPDIEKIFDRYYQIKQKALSNRYSGTGIGLYFSRALARIHHGYLWAENVTERSMVRFTLALPMDETPYRNEDFAEEEQNSVEVLSVKDNMNVHKGKDMEKKITVMVVDDDIDIANYMEMFLSRQFNVTVCYNTYQAYEALSKSDLPNIILTDLMMSDVDGLSFCRKIKSDKILCDIPVIVVTAKVKVDSKIEALEAGADAYITKPFEPSHIVAQIKSLLKYRKVSGGNVSDIPEDMELDIASMTPKEQQFMNRIFQILKNELSNPEFDIPNLAERLNVSRSKLFMDIKRITGMSPNDLIKKYRMVLAAELLKCGKHNVSEVAYSVGFSSLSYFSKAFKQYFGRSPKVLKK